MIDAETGGRAGTGSAIPRNPARGRPDRGQPRINPAPAIQRFTSSSSGPAIEFRPRSRRSLDPLRDFHATEQRDRTGILDSDRDELADQPLVGLEHHDPIAVGPSHHLANSIPTLATRRGSARSFDQDVDRPADHFSVVLQADGRLHGQQLRCFAAF